MNDPREVVSTGTLYCSMGEDDDEGEFTITADEVVSWSEVVEFARAILEANDAAISAGVIEAQPQS